MTAGPTLPALARKRGLARAALWFEQIWPAIWPALGIVGLYLGLALLDLPSFLPGLGRLALLAAVLLAAGLLLWRGLRRVVRPTEAMADRRLERESGLRHRPLATLADQPADPTPEQEALWRVHLARLAAAIPALRVGKPRPGLARRDGWALRGALLVFLVAAATIAGPDLGHRLVRAFVPDVPPLPAGPGTLVQAWITPPAYTGLPPSILRADATEARAPAGSHLTVSVTGGSGEPTLTLPGGTPPFRALDATSWQAEGDLGLEGLALVEIRRPGGILAAWTVTLIPDNPPLPLFTEPPGANVVRDRPTTQSRFAWQVTDDYGVAAMQVELRLAERPGAGPLVVPIPMSGSPKSAHGIVTPDLTAHPWAGLPVVARLVAKDAPGQTGESPAAAFTLPERDFQNPVARALVAVRRQLSLTPDDRRPARAVLDAIADQPDTLDNNAGLYLNLRAITALLARGREPDAVDEAQRRMWEMALALEENAPERTARALEQARDAVRDAMREEADPTKPTPAEQAEIDRRMQELREAIQRHMEALAEQARRDGTMMPLDPMMPQMNARDLDRLAQQLQQSLKDGRTKDAQEQMAQLEQLLQQLQNARPETGEERERRRAEQRQKGREQMDAVQDMVQREGKLLDRSANRADNPAAQAQAQAQNQPQPGRQPPQPGAQQNGAQQNGAQTAPSQQRAADAKAQAAMRRALGELMQRFGDLTGDIPAPLGEADQAMRQAGQALADGRDDAAGAATKRAIEALQKGGQQMGQQMAQQFGTGQAAGEGEEGDGPDGDGPGLGSTRNGDGRTTGPRPGQNPGSGTRRSTSRDPLGRPFGRGNNGSADAGDVPVPDDMEQARTRAIQDELRRRGADRTRPQPELDYIDRLLKPF